MSAMLRMSLICVAALPLLAGCRSSDEGSDAEVVATTTQVADIARNVTGDEAEVHGILTPNADPHDYEPRPSDATAIAGAEVVFTSGGEVDEWVDELIESSGTDAEVVNAPGFGSRRPHAGWRGRPALVAGPSQRGRCGGDDSRRALESRPCGRGGLRGERRGHISAIQRSDRAIAGCMNFLPDSARKLVTSHDSLGYFADRYDIEVVGAAVPALSTQAQPSSGETADLVELIQEGDVHAVFPEAGLSGDLESAIADEADVAVGGDLYADALGEEGTAGDTYLGALHANASALVEGLSNGARSCEPLGAE